ncbi:MAG: IS630 family transposase [Alphaproteobacteria bacterium]|nr:IS630 family transposase [Alphaproteobacteria bacterium]
MAKGKRVDVWFGDEARVGQQNTLTRQWAPQGSRPTALKDLRFSSAYIFGAVCPAQNKGAAIIMSSCDTEAMNFHLQEISFHVPEDAHAVLLMDGAAWHKSKGLIFPHNITPIIIPAYSPELNPAECIWHYMRSHWLSTRIFQDLNAVIEACVDSWLRFIKDPKLIGSVCRAEWAPAPTRIG